MGMWNHIPPRNLIHMSRVLRLQELEREMVDDAAAGYDTDTKLDEWMRLQDEMAKGPAA